MKKIIVSLILLSMTSLASDLPQSTYVGTAIPDSLLKNANAVVRYEKSVFTVKSVRKAIHSVRRVVTVLNPRGREFGEFMLTYSPRNNLDDLDITLYDAAGKELRSVKSKEIGDYPAFDGVSLYGDIRVKYATMYHDAYPYSIDIEYEYVYDGFLNWPTWYPEETNASVQYSGFQVEVPEELALRYWNNTGIEPDVQKSGRTTTYLWSITGLLPFELEPFSYGIDQSRRVSIAPNEFELEGYRGNLSSWQSFGEWFYSLYATQQDLPPKAREEVAAVLGGVAEPREKVRLLYRHLQSKTRYVSVQLGIGGWQPFSASYVFDRGYGDCKALTNYMVTLLKEAGVRAYPALINSGGSPQYVTADFSQNAFNHVILCVPLDRDTIWLECTSQSIPFGHIGRDNENRYALVVSERGGDLVRTPVSNPQDNLQVRKALVTIHPAGQAAAQVQALYTGNQQDRVRGGLNDATPKEKEEWLKNNLDIPVFTLTSADFFILTNEAKSAGVSLEIRVPRFASVAGNRLLFQPNLLGRRSYVPPAMEKRKNPIVHTYTYVDIDTITYKLPDGFSVEALPKPVTIETSFSTYHAAVTQPEPLKLRYTRRLEMRKLELPAEMYGEFRKFAQDVVQADKASAAIVRK